MQRGLPVLQTEQVGVRAPLQEHAAVRVVSFDDGVAQQEAVLDVDVGAVVQEDPNTAGALADDGQLERGGPLVAQGVHLRPELQQEANERVPAVVGRYVEGCPAVVALGVDDVAAELGLQHEPGDAGSAVHGGVVEGRESTDEVFYCGVGWREEHQKRREELGETRQNKRRVYISMSFHLVE